MPQIRGIMSVTLEISKILKNHLNKSCFIVFKFCGDIDRKLRKKGAPVEPPFLLNWGRIFSSEFERYINNIKSNNGILMSVCNIIICLEKDGVKLKKKWCINILK